MKKVLFLCTGNYYRSRFAEIFFNWHAEKLGLQWKAASRGLRLNPANAGPLSCYTESRLRDHGIPFEAYQRLPLDVTRADFADAHHVVAVKRAEHGSLMQSRFPAWMDHVEFWDVHDIDFAGPEDALPHLEREVIGLLGRLRTQETTRKAAG